MRRGREAGAGLLEADSVWEVVLHPHLRREHPSEGLVR